jgi:uncharacterized Zn finger protein
VAQAHGCDRPLWLALARAREQTHPTDAIEVYVREVDELIDAKKAAAYRSAVKLIGRIRRLHTAREHPGDFAVYLSDVRTVHKRKSSLMALLDRERW